MQVAAKTISPQLVHAMHQKQATISAGWCTLPKPSHLVAKTSVFNLRVRDTRALVGDHCIDGERWDWPFCLPIQQDILMMESATMHTHTTFVDGNFPSFSIVYTITSPSSACPTSREIALVSYACMERLLFWGRTIESLTHRAACLRLRLALWSKT